MQTELAREQMIEQQVRAQDVLDERVLTKLRKVPRELFVPSNVKYLAFADTEIPLPHGQHMLRPSLVGKILQALELKGTERVLEVGTGSGFMTACLAINAASVRSVELYPDLADLARANLISDLKDKMGVNNEGLGVVLHLLDQMHALRRALATALESARDGRPSSE